MRIAAGTSGRAIVMSGLTVMIALAGLFLPGYYVFTGVAFGTMAVVGVAVLGSLTVLPALLSWLGRWADRGRIPLLGPRRTAAKPSRLWAALVRRVVRRPAVWAGAAALALLALAAPALGMRLGNPANGGSPTTSRSWPPTTDPGRVPGGPAPGAGRGDRPGPGPAVASGVAERWRERVSASGPMRGPVTGQVAVGGRGLVIDVPGGRRHGQRDPQGPLGLREPGAPGHAGQGARRPVRGGGQPAATPTTGCSGAGPPSCWEWWRPSRSWYCWSRSGRRGGPDVDGLNLLSVGAAYGLITWIFQDGHLPGLLGFTSYGVIAPWVPLFLFVFLFGLTMDYHVFILSRVRDSGAAGRTTDAVVNGIASSAGVVTSAA